MTESAMHSVVSALILIEYQSLKTKMEFMQSTHASDHISPTHTVPTSKDATRPKSFYMKKATVDEQQGWKAGTVGWGGKTGLVKNLVSVPGFVPCTKEDEANILYHALRSMADYMVISADDDVGAKFLYVTGLPKGYAGFGYMTKGDAGVAGNARRTVGLPVQLPYNIVVVRATGTFKLLSTYPADQAYVDSRGTGYVGSRY